MPDIKARLDQIRERIHDKDFLANRGIGNEAGIHIFCYEAEYELVVRDYLRRLFAEAGDGARIIECDLYRIFLETLEDKRVLERAADLEERRGSEHLLTHLHRVATPAVLLEKMRYAPHRRGDVLFLTGIGRAFPFARAQNMLESMQEEFADIPVVMFYPGEFNGQQLSLFGRVFDGNYYRAFNLI